MRIIAGRAKSLPLKTVPGLDTRPTTDRIKETLFNMINPRLPGAAFLDLFAGSGGIGLEAASRGAAKVVFVEQSRKAAACIQENITFTKASGESTLLVMDVMAALRKLEGTETFDLIFMDPPYEKELERKVLEYLVASTLITEDTLIIVEASLATDFSYLAKLGFHVVKCKKYKTNAHLFLQKQAQAGGGQA